MVALTFASLGKYVLDVTGPKWQVFFVYWADDI